MVGLWTRSFNIGHPSQSPGVNHKAAKPQCSQLSPSADFHSRREWATLSAKFRAEIQRLRRLPRSVVLSASAEWHLVGARARHARRDRWN